MKDISNSRGEDRYYKQSSSGGVGKGRMGTTLLNERNRGKREELNTYRETDIFSFYQTSIELGEKGGRRSCMSVQKKKKKKGGGHTPSYSGKVLPRFCDFYCGGGKKEKGRREIGRKKKFISSHKKKRDRLSFLGRSPFRGEGKGGKKKPTGPI